MLTIKQYAELHGKTPAIVGLYVRNGRIPSTKVSPVLIDPATPWPAARKRGPKPVQTAANGPTIEDNAETIPEKGQTNGNA